MDEKRLSEIEERAHALPAGPWTAEEDGCVNGYMAVIGGDGEAVITALDMCCTYDEEADENVYEDKTLAEFIAAARDDLPALVAEVRRLRAGLREIRDGGAPTITWAQHLAALALSPATPAPAEGE